MAKVDPRDFLFNTDYEMDKIVWFKEFDFTIPSGQYRYSVQFEHGLKFAPLMFGVYAHDKNFSDPHNFDNTYFDPFTQGSEATSDETTVTYNHGIQVDDTQIHIFVRLYAFEPSNSHANVPKTSKFAKDFILNTDYNYTKMYEKGIIEFGDSSSYQTKTIEHKLGYRPQIMIWGETTQITHYVYKLEMMNASQPQALGFRYEPQVVLNPDSLTIKIVPTTWGDQFSEVVKKFHYRIYYDETK